MTDNTYLPFGTGPCVTFEIKPKKGFLPTAPFIQNKIKHRVDYYTMNQQLKYRNREVMSVSRYSPLDLFSYDISRVRVALRALVENPQNNFRLFIDGKLAYLCNEENCGSSEMFIKVFSEYCPHISYGDGCDEILNFLAWVLVSEPLLDRIKAMQMLDDCDIEGAFPCYEAMVKRGECILPRTIDSAKPRKPPLKPPIDCSPTYQRSTVQQYLISRTAKDCSLMITIKSRQNKSDPLRSTSENNIPISQETLEETSRDYRIKETERYIYSISAVDLDPKPLSKFPQWHSRDNQVVSCFSELEMMNMLA